MSKQTASNLFILSSLSPVYQRLLTGIATHQELGKRLLREIKLAHAFRRVEQVRELATVLINTPIKDHQLIAQYYLVWCNCRERSYESDALERIIEQTQTYKAQALLTRGTLDLYQSRPESALYFYNEALKCSHNIADFISVSLAIAQLKGIEGFNKAALKDLETLIPVSRHADPRLYYGFLNSYAVELSEAGRNEEAHNIIRRVVASPFAPAYPEWRDTFSELNQKLYRRRSSVTVPTPQPRLKVAKPQPKAKVIEFPKRDIKDIGADDLITELSKLDTISLTPLQLLGVLVKVMFKDRITDAEIDRLCNAYYQLIREYYSTS